MAAGIALLCENGWPAVTTRGVAERAGTNPGLIHYHFGGLPGLHAAIARAAGDLIIGPLVEQVLAAGDERAALDAIRRLMGEATTGDERATRLAVEVIAGAARDPELGDVLREQLREAREQVARWLGRIRPEWGEERCAGVAVLVTAAVDGLMLHYLLDPELGVGKAVNAVEGMLG